MLTRKDFQDKGLVTEFSRNVSPDEGAVNSTKPLQATRFAESSACGRRFLLHAGSCEVFAVFQERWRMKLFLNPTRSAATCWGILLEVKEESMSDVSLQAAEPGATGAAIPEFISLRQN